jgi:hypothetical protein
MIRLANESALGIYSFAWEVDGHKAVIQWGEGMTVPLAFFGRAMQQVARPERFGWTGPPKGGSKAQLKAVKAFAQAFADQLAADMEAGL